MKSVFDELNTLASPEHFLSENMLPSNHEVQYKNLQGYSGLPLFSLSLLQDQLQNLHQNYFFRSINPVNSR